jgi:hypothetical protein
MLFVAMHESPSGPERRSLPAPTWSRLGAKQTPLEVARMTRLTPKRRLATVNCCVAKVHSPVMLGAPRQLHSLAEHEHGRTGSSADTVQKGAERTKVALRWVRIAGKLA